MHHGKSCPLRSSIYLKAGDISPIDVISHLPVLCEDNEVPYVFIPAKEALGKASRTKRPTSVVLVSVNVEYIPFIFSH